MTKNLSRTRLAEFNPSEGLDRGAGRFTESIWYLVKMAFFLSAFPWPSRFRCALLRGFGARIGKGVVIKPRVNVHMPWKLSIADDVWIGEEAFILNFELVTVGANCVISQRAFLCCGNHDYREPSMPYRNAPITLEDGVWVGAQSFVGPGVTIGAETVVAACSVVTATRLEPNGVYAGNPATRRGERWKSQVSESTVSPL